MAAPASLSLYDPKLVVRSRSEGPALVCAAVAGAAEARSRLVWFAQIAAKPASHAVKSHASRSAD